MKVYYEKDANLDLIKSKKIAIFGYGSQGHAHALNLKDSGASHLVIGLRDGSSSAEKAAAEGFNVMDLSKAAEWADVIMMLVPDELQADVYKEHIEEKLKTGGALAFAHGLNVHFKLIEPRDDLDVFMIAPKGPGHTVRSEYKKGGGVPCLVAIDSDKSGEALPIALSYASYSLPDHFNTRIDRGTMMHSVESRVPLQAPSLVNLMIGTPAKWRYNKNYTKYILRRVVERHLGKEVAYRKKYGFAYPIWKNKNLNQELDMGKHVMESDLFESPCFNKDVKKFFLDELKTDNRRHIWMAYCASKTYDKFKEINKNNNFSKAS